MSVETIECAACGRRTPVETAELVGRVGGRPIHYCPTCADDIVAADAAAEDRRRHICDDCDGSGCTSCEG